MMNLGDYYRQHGKGMSATEALSTIRTNVKQMFKESPATNATCKLLEDYLNDAFYPDENSKLKDYPNKINKLITEAYYAQHKRVIQNFSIGASGVRYTEEDLPFIIRDRYDATSHTSHIHLKTLRDRLEKTKNVLEKLVEMPDTSKTDEIRQYESEVEKLQNGINDFINTCLTDEQKKMANFKIDVTKDKKIFSAIATLDAQYDQLAKTMGEGFIPKDYGDVLEWTLQAFSHEDRVGSIIEGVTDEMIRKELLEKVTSTAGSVTTGKSDINVSAKFDYKGPAVNFSKNEKDEKMFTVSDGNTSFTCRYVSGFKPDSDRQGKMDVEFVFNTPDPNGNPTSTLRISAKNWQSMNRDFGKTYLAYGLIRSTDIPTTKRYAFTMQDNRASAQNSIGAAHKLAKYALLVDILMGYSQKSNYADTLVINNRAKSRVVVISLPSLLTKMHSELTSPTDKLGGVELNGYNATGIQERMQIIKRAIDKHETKDRTDKFINLAMKFMQGISVEVHFSNIKKFL